MNDSVTTETTTLAVLSGKGGTGKSILVASIGYILSHCGFKTLLIDVDFATHGLTFYALAGLPRLGGSSTAELLLMNRKNRFQIEPIAAPLDFCNRKLQIFPSITRRRDLAANWVGESYYLGSAEFAERMQALISAIVKKHEFDYIVCDTRGGTDATSVGAALASDGFVVVTEADKPSWDMGRLLLDSIEESDKQGTAACFGFIINKNVLPSEAIESFLRRHWETTHLATIPLDPNAIRYFQEDKIPVADDICCPFSIGILEVIRKLFFSGSWPENSISLFNELEKRALEAAKARERLMRIDHQNIKISKTIRAYGLVFSFFALSYTLYGLFFGTRIFFDNIYAIIIYVISILTMMLGEAEFINKLFSKMLRQIIRGFSIFFRFFSI